MAASRNDDTSTPPLSCERFMIFDTPKLILVGAVAAVGVLHTIVPDHWVPITLIARQRGWSRSETARTALKAGTGHVLSTLAIAVAVWIAGVAFAQHFGQFADTAASIALVGFGGWIAISSLMELQRPDGNGHGHSHSHSHSHDHWISSDTVHGPELQQIKTGHGTLDLSIFESGVPPRFRLTGAYDDTVQVETIRDDGSRQVFILAKDGAYWESVDEIPEPHQFSVVVRTQHGDHTHTYNARFTEHKHGPCGHTHGEHIHKKTSSRTALLLILGSSPMVEGIPAFFAAGKYGPWLIAVMSLVFALATIITYVVLCVYSTAGLQRVSFGSFERYGEVLSGTFIAVIGAVFWIWPVL